MVVLEPDSIHTFEKGLASRLRSTFQVIEVIDVYCYHFWKWNCIVPFIVAFVCRVCLSSLITLVQVCHTRIYTFAVQKITIIKAQFTWEF